MTVKKSGSHSMAARQEKHAYHGSSSSDHLKSWKNLFLGVILAIGFVLYTTFLVQDISQRTNFAGYLSPDSRAGNDFYYKDGLKGAGQTPGTAPTVTPAENKVNSTATRQGDIPKSSNAKSQEDLQDGSLANSTSAPAPTAITIPSGHESVNATVQPMDGPSSGKNEQAQQRVQDGSQVANSTTRSSGKFSVLVGVMIMAYEMKRRDIIRLAYRERSFNDFDFTVRFILGGYQLVPWLEGENATHGDLIVLQCKENLNEGKTFTFFSSLPDIGYQYDYVMKTDDDAYVNFANLGKHLKPLPRTDLYYGYSLPCDRDDEQHESKFRVGAGYVLSWDLVVWIRDSPIPRNNSIGTEDMLVGEWFQQGGVGKNRPSSHGLFHDYPEQGGPCAKNLTMESILIHKLKTDERWYKVTHFYNTSTSVNNLLA